MARDFVAARVNYRQFCVIVVPVIRTDFEDDARAAAASRGVANSIPSSSTDTKLPSRI
jgi:hypothetical protein